MTHYQMHDKVTWANQPEALEVVYTLYCGMRCWFVGLDAKGGYWAAEDEGEGNWSLVDEAAENAVTLDVAIDQCRRVLERADG